MPATTPTETSAETKATAPRRSFAWLTAALFVYVSWEALRPDPGGSSIDQLDKLLHFMAFATLAVSSALASSRGRRSHWTIAALLLLYGALIEIVQAYVPGRDSSWLDLMADGVGIAAGLGLVTLLRRLPLLQRLE